MTTPSDLASDVIDVDNPSPAAFAKARATRPEICGSYAPERPYPIYLRGTVERGFGRGGKDLGCPTANLPSKVMQSQPSLQRTGIYFGYARVLPQDPDDPDLLDGEEAEGSSDAADAKAQISGQHAIHDDDDVAIQMDDDGDDIVLSASPINEESEIEFLGSGQDRSSLKRRQLSRSSIRSNPSVNAVLDKAERLGLERTASTGSGQTGGETSPASATSTKNANEHAAHQSTPTSQQQQQNSGPSSSHAESCNTSTDSKALPPSSRTGSIQSSQSGSLRKKRKARVHLASQDAQVFPMVMSVGWNPFYKNTSKTAEVHVMHPFQGDFYGLEMRVVVLGYIRPEYNYVDKEALIQDIETDKKVAINSLARRPYEDYQSDPFLSAPS